MHPGRMFPLTCILILSATASARRAPQGTTQPPTSSSGPNSSASGGTDPATRPTPSTRKGPLGDYVPCLFSSDEQWEMRALPAPEASQARHPNAPQNIDYATAAKLIDAVNSAIEKFGRDNNYDIGLFQSEFNQELAPKDLVGKTPDQAYGIVDSRVRATNQAIKGNYFTSKNPPGGQIENAAAQALAGLLGAANAASVELVKSVAPQTRPFQAPDDVSCSISVMSWKETSDVFGRRVANEFVALQVTVRNLNTKNEFLIHDIQVAVDTGVAPEYFGRFQAGRDKLLVRAVAQRGQSEDRRNLVVNALQMVGAIAGASSITAGTVQFKDAVAVFQGAFIQGFVNLFPDHTVEQLNHINDLVFSASNTSKVVVPIQGAVPLVTFIAEKPIEQLPFAWCGYTHNGILWRRDFQHCVFDEKTTSGNVPPRPYPDERQYDSDRPWDDLQFKRWKPAALRMLQEHTFVVIGGVHIQEVTTQPKVVNLDCPTLSNGAIDISQTKDGMVNCTLTGSGLSPVSSVTLEKGDSKIGGKVKPAIDGNSAVLQFKPDDLSDNAGIYSLHLTYKSGSQSEPTETDSNELVTLAKQPIISSADTLDLSSVTSAKPTTLSLHGKDLDQLNDVSLVPDDGGVSAKSTQLTTQGGSTASVSLNLDSLAKAGTDATKKYHVAYSSKADPNKQIDLKSVSVTVTGRLPTTAQAPKGAAGAGKPTGKAAPDKKPVAP